MKDFEDEKYHHHEDTFDYDVFLSNASSKFLRLLMKRFVRIMLSVYNCASKSRLLSSW